MFLGFLMATLALKLRLDHAFLARHQASLRHSSSAPRFFDTTLVTISPRSPRPASVRHARKKIIPRIAWLIWAWASAAQS